MLLKEAMKIVFGYSADDIVINLYGYTVGTSAQTKGSREVDSILQVVNRYCLLHQLNDIIRAFDMAGASYTDIDIHWLHQSFRF